MSTEHRVRISSLLGTAIVLAAGLAVSVVTSTVVASRAYRGKAQEVLAADREITVKGSARLPVSADQAVWQIQVAGEGETLATAFDDLEAGVERVRQFLADAGFEPASIQTQAIQTDTHYQRDENGRATRTVIGHTLSRRFAISTAEVDRVARTANQVTELIRENLRIRSFAPEYTYSKVADLKVRILGEASADARTRAEKIALESGCVITEVRSARMGVIQITQPHSTDVSSYGIYDTATIDKDISVVVTATFGLAEE